MSAIQVFFYNYSEFRRDVKTRPLFGRSPLFGVSVKREFTVIQRSVPVIVSTILSFF